MSTSAIQPGAFKAIRVIVVITLDAPRYALSADAVELVIPALEITPLPGAPDIVLGVINLHGAVLPVMDIRARFRLPQRPPDVDDHFVIVRTARRRLVFPVDRVVDVRDIASCNIVDTDETKQFEGYLSGIVRLDNDIVLIHDVDSFLSIDEERLLDEALDAS
jgi:purine-binding chemotaxis protein CheW